MISFETTTYNVQEPIGNVEVCAFVDAEERESFPFNVSFSTKQLDGEAGTERRAITHTSHVSFSNVLQKQERTMYHTKKQYCPLQRGKTNCVY